MSEQFAVAAPPDGSEATGTTDQEDRRARRRSELLDATTALVRRVGPNVSMDQIAAECGVTKPILYRHFGDRDGLVFALASRFTETIGHEVLQIASQGSVPPRQALAGTIDVYLRLIEENAELYHFIGQNKPAGPRQMHLVGLVADQISTILRANLAAAGLPTDVAQPIAYALVGMVHTVGQWWANERTFSRAELVETLVVLVWDGMGSLPLPDDRIVPVE